MEYEIMKLSGRLPMLIAMCAACYLAGPASGKRPSTRSPACFRWRREADLREAFAKIPDVKLIGIDFKNAEVVLEYDPAKLLPKAKPEQMLQKLDTLLKNASNHTFGIKPLRTTPLEKLTLITIPVAGLDCKACCLAAYESVYKLEGVERATASFRERQVTALIDPAKTNR